MQVYYLPLNYQGNPVTNGNMVLLISLSHFLLHLSKTKEVTTYNEKNTVSLVGGIEKAGQWQVNQ